MRSDVEKEVGSITTNIIMLIITLFIEGWGIMVMWGWFVAPTFGLPSLGLAQAIGLNIFVSLFTARSNDGRDKLERRVTYYLTLLVALGLGWIVHLFM